MNPLLLLQLPTAAVAQVTPPVSDADRPVIQQMVRDQLAAFERDDAEAAWKHVAPGLQQKFGGADRFLELVRKGYEPVYRPQKVTFRDIAMFDGQPAQWLDVIGPRGGAYRALYLLEKQPDGSWRTAGCLLFLVEKASPLGA